jgi:hypothetical protein
MTFKDLERVMLKSQEQSDSDSPAMKDLLKRVRDKPFWIWGKSDEHERRYKNYNGNCCTTHILGQPLKNGKSQPFWDYQFSVFKALFDDTYINFRQPTEEERDKYNKLMVEAELKSQTKTGNIK